MISVIIPVYNQPKKLEQCLESLSKQTYKDLEVIIVDDGSKEKVTCRIPNAKCRIIHQENKGAPAARNRGFKESTGEYVLFCDADAILELMALEIMLNILVNHAQASYTYSNFFWGRKLFRLKQFSKEETQTQPCIHTTSLIRREHFPIHGWDESIKKLQDWDIWLTMLREGHTGIWIDKILFKIKPGGTMSSWLPKFFYKLFPFLPQVKTYKQAVKIIKQKHNILF